MQLPGQHHFQKAQRIHFWLEPTAFGFCQKWLNYNHQFFILHLLSCIWHQIMFMLLATKLISELSADRNIGPFAPKGRHVHHRKNHITWMSLCSHAQFTVRMQSGGWCQSVLHWETLGKAQVFPPLRTHFWHFFKLCLL